MTAAEWEFSTRLLLTTNPIYPHLTSSSTSPAPPAVQMTRIKARGRSFEAGYTLEYLSPSPIAWENMPVARQHPRDNPLNIRLENLT